MKFTPEHAKQITHMNYIDKDSLEGDEVAIHTPAYFEACMALIEFSEQDEASDLTLSSLAQRQWSWVDSMQWHNKTNLEALALVCSEVGEAINETRGDNITPAFGEELADIILRVVDLAYGNDIQIEKEVVQKMLKNQTLRPGNPNKLK